MTLRIVAGESSRPGCFESTREPTGCPSTIYRSTRVFSSVWARGSSMRAILQPATDRHLPGTLADRQRRDHASVGYGPDSACALIPAMVSTAPSPASAARFRRVALIGRHVSPDIAEPLSRLASFLVARGHDVVIEADTARSTRLSNFATAPAADLGAHADVAIVLGGDGT